MRPVPENVARISVAFHCDQHFVFFCGNAYFTLYRSSRTSRWHRKMSKMKKYEKIILIMINHLWFVVRGYAFLNEMMFCKNTGSLYRTNHLISQSSRVEPTGPKTAFLRGRGEKTTATLTTLASKIQQKNPYVAAIHLSALLLPSILPVSETFPSAVTVCLPIFVLRFVVRPRAPYIRTHKSHNTLSHHATSHHITSHNTPSHPFVSHDIALHIPHQTTPHLATSLSLPPHVTSPPNT